MNFHRPNPTRLLALAALLGSLILSACGGGGGGTTAGGGGGSSGGGSTPAAPVNLNGVVADGLIQGAQVCYDLNDNGRCDSGEPVSSSTGANGAYTLSVPASEAGKHAVIAIVPVGAVDADTGTVTVAYTLKAPANTNTVAPLFVSPITTIVQEVMQASGSTNPAAAIELVKQQLGMTISPLDNFIELRATNTDAARAGSIAQVVTALKQEVGSTAASAGVDQTQTQALLSVVVLNNLSNLANSIAEQGTKTAVQAAQELATSQGLTSATVAIQAQIASSVLTSTRETATTTTPTPFVTLRDFRYTDANNWSYRLFTGTDQLQSDNFKYANEIRKERKSGIDKPYNRDASFYDTAASRWYECPSDGYQIIKYTAPTATADGTSLYCRTFSNTNKRSDESIAGSTIKSIVERIRNSGLPGYNTWGPDPSILSNTVTFPAGSVLRYQLDTSVATPDAHSLSSKVRVFKNTTKTNFNDWPFAATLDEMIQYYPGNIISGTPITTNGGVTGSNTDGLRDIPDPGFVQSGFQSVKNFRVAYQATSATTGNARFYLCRRNTAGNTRCDNAFSQVLFDTTYSIVTLGDARVLKFANFPTENESYWKYRRQLTERAGAVFYGSKDILATTTSIRMNQAAWDALRAQLPSVTTHADPTAPVAVDAASWLRDMREDLQGADTFSIRVINSQVTNTTTGSGSFSEVRLNFNNGVSQPFNRNQLYLVGGVWKTSDGADNQCRSSGVGIGTFTSNPRGSAFCGVSQDSSTGFDVDISGRTISAVVTELKQYGSFDGSRDASNLGPTVLSTDPEYTTWTTSVFPTGSRLRYQVVTTNSNVDTINLGSIVRSGSPSVTVTSLASLTSTFSGGFGSTPTGGNTLGLFQFMSSETPGSTTYSGIKRIRISFESGTNNARFWSCDTTLPANGYGTTNCTQLHNTTYSVTTVNGIDILRPASYPSIVTNQLGSHTFLAQNAGVVYFGGVTPNGYKSHSQRLNQTAYQALFNVFGVTIPAQTCTGPTCP